MNINCIMTEFVRSDTKDKNDPLEFRFETKDSLIIGSISILYLSILTMSGYFHFHPFNSTSSGRFI